MTRNSIFKDTVKGDDKSILGRVLNADTSYTNPMSLMRDNETIYKAQEPVGYEFLRPSNIRSIMIDAKNFVPRLDESEALAEIKRTFFDFGSSRSVHVDPTDKATIKKRVRLLNSMAVAQIKARIGAQNSLHSARNLLKVETDRRIHSNPAPELLWGGPAANVHRVPHHGNRQRGDFTRERVNNYHPFQR